MPLDRSWCNDEAAANAALADGRLEAGDRDEGLFQRKAHQACGLIARFLDRRADAEPITDPDDLADLHEAHVQLTIELVLRKDAPFGLAGLIDDDAASFRIGADPIAGIRRLVGAHKQQWGLA